ncbi:hypothetical protein [Pseudomonas sp.]|uniref:hypothetical protein n=1 Tax=Pseudomonas sp. TaxID=306 RepID=UPI0028A60741|nr:hypothetical protein [Pseudomonas sp.]
MPRTRADSNTQLAAIFDQLLALRESVHALHVTEQDRAISLRGHQTVDDDEALDLAFAKLQDDIAGIEEGLATIAEAMGDIPKL